MAGGGSCLVLAIFSLAICPLARGQGLAFASYYGNNMVLQQGPKRANIWGYATLADLGKTIELELRNGDNSINQKYNAAVRLGPFTDLAVWSVLLQPSSNKGPFSITVTLEARSVSITNVLFGDVWICSGQSNMVFRVRQMTNASQELDIVENYPEIRVFTVANVFSEVPLYELPGVRQPWSLPTQASIGAGPYFSALCWTYGRNLYDTLATPLGLIVTAWGGTPVEAWSSPDALAACGLNDQLPVPILSLDNEVAGPRDRTQLWNSMVHPLLNMTIYGAIWYQGESNAGAAVRHTYNCSFPAMIDDWRAKFNAASGQTDGQFPFGFAQLAPNRNVPTVTTGFPDIRWHQTADYGYVPNARMNNVFMAVAMDLPDFSSPYGSIHPRDKPTIGRRLSRAGLAVAYGRQLYHTGPLPTGFTIQAGPKTLTIEFDHGLTRIRVKTNDGYEVCCSSSSEVVCPAAGALPAGTRWAAAPISQVATHGVTLDWSACGEDTAVGLRYAWRESPCAYQQCAVYSEGGDLPAPPVIVERLAGGGKKPPQDRQGLRKRNAAKSKENRPLFIQEPKWPHNIDQQAFWDPEV